MDREPDPDVTERVNSETQFNCLLADSYNKTRDKCVTLHLLQIQIKDQLNLFHRGGNIKHHKCQL